VVSRGPWHDIRFRALYLPTLESWIGWGGFVALLLGMYLLPEPYAGWSAYLSTAWCAMCFAYALSASSNGTLAGDMKNAVIVCVVLAGIVMAYYGEPRFDDYGYVTEEGFPTTFDSKAGAAVTAFVRFVVPSLLGVRIAHAFKQSSAPPAQGA